MWGVEILTFLARSLSERDNGAKKGIEGSVSTPGVSPRRSGTPVTKRRFAVWPQKRHIRKEAKFHRLTAEAAHPR